MINSIAVIITVISVSVQIFSMIQFALAYKGKDVCKMLLYGAIYFNLVLYRAIYFNLVLITK